MIEGIAIRCNVGPVELLRTPLIELTYRRRAVLSHATLEIPDPTGEVRAVVSVGQPVTVRFWYRGEAALAHQWEGTVARIDQPRMGSASADAILVHAVGQEKKLTSTMVTESFYGEPAQAVARRLLERTGLPVASVDIPADILPHQVFSGVSVARAIKQLEVSLTRAFGHDLSKHAVWLGANGLLWSAEDEPGAVPLQVPLIESVHNLIHHTPPEIEGGMGVVTAFLLPGLTASRKVRIHDARRGFDSVVRAQEVIHQITRSGNRTIIRYGKDQGWGA